MAFSSMQQTRQPRYQVDYETQSDEDIEGCYPDVTCTGMTLMSIRNGLPGAVMREISILKELNHENVVRLLKVRTICGRSNLFFERVDSDLGKMINNGTNIDDRFIKNIIFQTLQGVSHCHFQKVLHRNLKPTNLLIDPVTNRLKLAGFEYARTFDDFAVLEYSAEVGTTAYKAPELLLCNSPYTTAVDIWSVGCIFAEMVIGYPLFNGITDTLVKKKIIKMLGVPNELNWPGVKSDCLKVGEVETLPIDPLQKLADVVHGLEPAGLDLLQKMLCMIPGKRISAFDAMEHPYFKD